MNLSIHERMRVWRERKRLGIHAVARRVGVAPSTVSKIENGHLRLPRDLVEPWAEAIGVDPDVLFYGWGFVPPDLRAAFEVESNAREVRELYGKD